MNKGKIKQGIFRKVENQVTGKLHSVEDFAKLAFESVNLNYKKFIKIDKKLKRKKDSNARQADISKIKKVLKWSPKINFRNLVHDMVNKDLERVKKDEVI